MERFYFLYNGKKYEYQLIKGRRKSLSILIEKAGGIIVKAPLYSSATEIQKLVEKKRIGSSKRQNKR